MKPNVCSDKEILEIVTVDPSVKDNFKNSSLENSINVKNNDSIIILSSDTDEEACQELIELLSSCDENDFDTSCSKQAQLPQSSTSQSSALQCSSESKNANTKVSTTV